MRTIYALISDHEVLLSLEPEDLAGIVLEYFNSQVRSEGGTVGSANMISHDWLSRDYPREHIENIRYALVEAVVWLKNEGLVAQDPGQGEGWLFITRRGRKLSNAEAVESYRKANLLPKELLHPIMVDKVFPLFLRGTYDTAVFQAFKEVEVAVRDAGGHTDEDQDVELMEKAFDPENGTLTDMTQTEDEKQAVLSLFTGAMRLYKSPPTHRNVDFTSEEASEAIIFANRLLKMVICK